MNVVVKKLRKRLDLPQTEFGQLLGVHPMTVSRWERGEHRPTPYQQALMNEFDKAAAQPKIVEELKTLLVAAGVVAAILLLLKAAQK
jgi:putative transcriptional regulator